MSKTQPARGMRDFLPADIRKREYVINIIKEVYESYGFEPLETPAVENLETLTGKYGEEGNQLIFKILKRGEKLDINDKELADLALRYDLTVPLARVVANNRDKLPKFFKRYQIQPVWRADRPARGRFREFYQCDVDAIGSKSMVVEAELISAVCEILKRLGFEDFTIRLNSRKILEGVLDTSTIPVEQHMDVLVALDKLDKIGQEGVAKELSNRGISDKSKDELINRFEYYIEKLGRGNLTSDQITKLKEFEIEFAEYTRLGGEMKELVKREEGGMYKPRRFGNWWKLLLSDPDAHEHADLSKEFIAEKLSSIQKIDEVLCALLNENVLLQLKLFIGKTKNGAAGINELSEVLAMNQGISNVRIDPTLARGLSYYTGAIFEISVPDLAGSLGGGGRYDGLIGMFGKEEIPACGFSLGLERIIVVMEERGMFPAEVAATSADVMVTIWNEDGIAESLKLAGELRSAGLRVTLYPEADKLGKQFKYADSIGVEYVCVLGESELAEGKVTLKNMKTGEQETVEREKVAEKVKE